MSSDTTADNPLSTATGSPLSDGLTQAEAARLLSKTGTNEVASEVEHPLRQALKHFWAPVPWMLEITILLQLAAGERLEAAMVAILLFINVGLGLLQDAGFTKSRTRISVSRGHRWSAPPG